jgi:hypothetical protein
MIHSAIGISDDIDPLTAINQIITSCQEQLGPIIPQAGLFFTSCMEADFAELLQRITQAFPNLELIGCTTDGEFSRDTGFIEDAFALLLLAGDGLEFASAVARDISRQPEESFRAAVSEARGRLHSAPVCALTFPDGISTFDFPYDRVFRHSFGENFPVFGGTAGDHWLFTGTYQFHRDQVYRDAAPLLMLAGDLQIAHAVEAGPIPFGPSYPVTRHHKNVLYEIDGKSAIAFHQEHFGTIDNKTVYFPLAAYQEESDNFLLRDQIGYNHDEGSISFLGNFPEQCRVRLTLVSRESVLDAAGRANQAVLLKSEFTPELLLLFPCCSLRHVLGSKTSEKFALLKSGKAPIPFFGFYCYGELAPPVAGTSTFHSDTYVILALASTRR